MAKDKVIKPLTEEQRERIRNMPGVVVHRRDPSEKRTRFVPSIWLDEPVSVRELLGRDDYDEDQPE